MTLILFVIILGVTVLVHEFGHYLFARITGVHVHQFSIGMGPAIYKKESKKTGIVYAVRAIPLGGFVQLAGEEVEVEETKKKYPGKTLQDKNVFQRFLIMFFGAGFNFIFATVLLFVIGLIFGAKSLEPTLSIVEENSPAYVAGLRAGDKVTRINKHKVTYIDDISVFLQVVNRDEPVTFEVIRQGEESKRTFEVLATKEIIDDETVYRYGIGMQSVVERGFFKSIKYAFNQAGALFKQMFVVLGNLFTGKLSVSQLSGPVGIYSIVGEAKALGIASLLSLTAFLSINVGVVNLLPIPAFDGGRILFLFIEKIKGSPISPKVENIIHSIGFVLLIILIIYVTLNDILRLF